MDLGYRLYQRSASAKDLQEESNPPIGPVDSKLFYYHLTSIAIDHLKHFGT